MTFCRRIQAILFPADSGRWLAILRTGLALLLFFYLFSLLPDWNRLLGNQAQGLFGREVGEAMTLVQSPAIPRVGWLILLSHHVGMSESATLSLVWWALLASTVLLLVGLFSRSAAILAWFLQLACAKSGGLLSYGADNFITIGLFYLMIAPLPGQWSLDHRWRRANKQDLYSLGCHRRVLQLHLCFIYFFSGLSKALGTGWWNGENLWRALTMPPFAAMPPSWIARVSFLLPAFGIAIWLLEISYPALIWWRRSRSLALAGICAMHLAIGVLMNMYLFAGSMLVLNLAAFLPNEQRTILAEPSGWLVAKSEKSGE